MKKNKFSIVYADPAWSYKCWSQKGKGRSASHHYDVMTIEDIKALPVHEIADDNAVLFLWVTFPVLPEALEVIKAWGFIYKTNAFTWVKRNRKSNNWFLGMGYYTRANAEICVVATKGKGLPRRSKAVHSIIDAPVEEHSKKPDLVRQRIVALFGNVPRVELFARRRAVGWVTVGNEIDGRDIRQVLHTMACDRARGESSERAA